MQVAGRGVAHEHRGRHRVRQWQQHRRVALSADVKASEAARDAGAGASASFRATPSRSYALDSSAARFAHASAARNTQQCAVAGTGADAVTEAEVEAKAQQRASSSSSDGGRWRRPTMLMRRSEGGSDCERK
jgi:hypothetical protein